jgi:hypothetical protein
MKSKKIKFFTGHDSVDVDNYYLSLTPGSKGFFNGYHFSFNQNVDDYDFIVVFDGLYEPINVNIPKEKIIFVAGEPTSIKNYDQSFLDQFGHIITCQNKINHKSVFLKSPGHTWFSKKTYDQLTEINYVRKSKLISIVASNKIFTKGHKDRFEFCLKLKERLGDKVDLFGRGFNEFDDKWEVIAPYKYSIAIENSVEDNWVTEKLGDCYTSHTFPFYMGAPNIEEYYNSESYELIDINNFDESLSKILKVVNDPSHYDSHLESLKEAKHAYLNKHSLIPMVCNFIDKLDINEFEKLHKEVLILPEKINFLKKTKLYNFFTKLRQKTL